MEAEKNVVTYEARDGQQVKLSFDTIKRYLVQGHPEWVTNQELVYFMGICRSRALNPFAKDCYLLKFSERDPAAIITAIDYFRKRAKVQKDCKGWSRGIIVERDGEVVYSNGLMLESDTLLGGWFEAQPEGWEKPYKLEVNLKGYIKKKRDGSVTSFWSKDNQPSQIAKVAESQGLRTIWPDEFQQLYTPEEIGESDMFTSAENPVSNKINGRGKGKPQTEAKEDIYKAKEASEGKTTIEPDRVEEKTEEGKEDPIRAAYINLKKTGFKPYVEANLQAIKHLAEKYQKELQAKWIGFYPDEPFPGTEPDEKSEPTSGLPGGPVGDPDKPETDTEEMLQLVEGGYMSESGFAIRGCPNRPKGEAVLRTKCYGIGVEPCKDRVGCPNWATWDKKHPE